MRPPHDPTGDTAAANVDRERSRAAGVNPDIVHELAEAYLPPPEDPTWNLRMMPRDEDGERLGIPPDAYVGPYGLVPDGPITNEQAAQIVYQLALHLNWNAA